MAADAVCMTVTAAGGETELPVQATNVKQVAARTTGTDRVDFFIAHLSGREGMRVPT
jgi:lactate dehydrogenase-like 2-hydroxyacid dehydrogenase